MTPAVDGLEQQLREALLEAFPGGQALNRFIRHRLDEHPEIVAAGENLDARVDRLLQWARKHQKLDTLIEAAVAESPANPRLVAAASAWKAVASGASHPLPPDGAQAAAVARIAGLPRGPLVPAGMITESLVRAYATIADSGYLARRTLREAARLRLAAEQNGLGASVIQPEDLPVFEAVSANAFWWEAFTEARKHGPRMLAALLFAQPDALFPPDASRDRHVLLDQLEHFGSPRTEM